MASFTAMPRLMRRCSALFMGATPVGLPPPAAGRKLGPKALAAAPICCLQQNLDSLLPLFVMFGTRMLHTLLMATR